MWESIRDFYSRQIDHISVVLVRSHDPVQRLEAIRRLLRMYVRLHRLPENPDLASFRQRLGDAVFAMAEIELEINHSYCSALQDLRRELRLMTEARHDPGQAAVRQREEVARLQAQRDAIVRLIMRR